MLDTFTLCLGDDTYTKEMPIPRPNDAFWAIPQTHPTRHRTYASADMIKGYHILH